MVAGTVDEPLGGASATVERMAPVFSVHKTVVPCDERRTTRSDVAEHRGTMRISSVFKFVTTPFAHSQSKWELMSRAVHKHTRGDKIEI